MRWEIVSESLISQSYLKWELEVENNPIGTVLLLQTKNHSTLAMPAVIADADDESETHPQAYKQGVLAFQQSVICYILIRSSTVMLSLLTSNIVSSVASILIATDR